jgi:superfamily I DNA/RNA helicase
MFYNTERHLLYVACTRARDHLLVTSTAPASEFLDSLEPPLRREQGLAARKSTRFLVRAGFDTRLRDSIPGVETFL